MSDAAPPLILHVIHHLVTGGLENGLVNLVNRLPRSEFRHAIACVEDFSEFRNRIARDDVDVIALRRSRIGIWRLRAQVYALCRRLRPAIVHTRNLSGLDALLPARLAGVARSVHSEHGWDVGNLKGGAFRPALLRRLHAPLVDRYVVVSKDLERYLVERAGIAASRITHICNGVDTDAFVPANVKPVALLPEHMQTDAPFIVGTVGRIQPIKDQATLVRAFAELVRARPALRGRLRLAIVGDGPLIGELHKLAHEEGVADIAWLPGMLDNVREVLRLFDVFALTSLNEGISNTILEAMASGVPVIASRVGGNVEIVEDGRWGRWFEPGNVPELCRCLAEYVDAPALRDAHAAGARKAAIERFGLGTMVDGYREIYESLIERDRLCHA